MIEFLVADSPGCFSCSPGKSTKASISVGTVGIGGTLYATTQVTGTIGVARINLLALFITGTVVDANVC